MLTEQDIKNINEASGKLTVVYKLTTGEYVENYESAIAEQMLLDGTYMEASVHLPENDDLSIYVDTEHIKGT